MSDEPQENPQNHDIVEGNVAADKPSQAEGEDTPELDGEA
jgi:hypothetical protein